MLAVVRTQIPRGVSLATRPAALSAVRALSNTSTTRVPTANTAVMPSRSSRAAFAPATRRAMSATPLYKDILTETKGKVAVITLNRPKALNALNSNVIGELNDALAKFDANPQVHAIVLTGSEKSFAAGADIKEMVTKNFVDCLKTNYISNWGDLTNTRKPLIAAVNGFAFGGGCEVAMMCDIIYAGDNAVFSQPEISIGTIPGGGGTQRLAKAIGKSRAMEMILTGERIDAAEALRLGLVSKVFPAAETLPKAMELADKIASFSSLHTILAKETINQSYELGLTQGLQYEVRAFWSSFGTADKMEGMKAFVEKRKPEFKDE